MSKNKYLVVQELDPESVNGISELHKKHYLSLGYKPYMMGDGRIRWLTDAQRVYRATQGKHFAKFKIGREKSTNIGRRRRKRRNRLLAFIRDNWLILLLVAIAIGGIIYFMR